MKLRNRKRAAKPLQYYNALLSRAKAQGGFTEAHRAELDELCDELDEFYATPDPDADATRECFVNDLLEERMADGFTYQGAAREVYADMVRMVEASA